MPQPGARVASFAWRGIGLVFMFDFALQTKQAQEAVDASVQMLEDKTDEDLWAISERYTDSEPSGSQSLLVPLDESMLGKAGKAGNIPMPPIPQGRRRAVSGGPYCNCGKEAIFSWRDCKEVDKVLSRLRTLRESVARAEHELTILTLHESRVSVEEGLASMLEEKRNLESIMDHAKLCKDEMKCAGLCGARRTAPEPTMAPEPKTTSDCADTIECPEFVQVPSDWALGSILSVAVLGLSLGGGAVYAAIRIRWVFIVEDKPFLTS